MSRSLLWERRKPRRLVRETASRLTPLPQGRQGERALRYAHRACRGSHKNLAPFGLLREGGAWRSCRNNSFVVSAFGCIGYRAVVPRIESGESLWERRQARLLCEKAIAPPGAATNAFGGLRRSGGGISRLPSLPQKHLAPCGLLREGGAWRQCRNDAFIAAVFGHIRLSRGGAAYRKRRIIVGAPEGATAFFRKSIAPAGAPTNASHLPALSHQRLATINQLLNGVSPYNGCASTRKPVSSSVARKLSRVG